MYGLKFHDGSNSMVCLNAEFFVEDRNKPRERYRYAAGPHGGYLDQKQGDGWVRIAKGKGIEQQLLDTLPIDCGIQKWTWLNFVLALTFWAEGRRKGKVDAAYQ